MAGKRWFWRPNLRNYCEKIRWLWLTAKPKKLLEKDKMVFIASYCKPKKWECGCLVRDRIMAQRRSFVSKLCPLNFWMVQSVACLRFFGRAHPPRVVKPLYLPAEVRPELRGRRWRSGGRRQQLKGPACMVHWEVFKCRLYIAKKRICSWLKNKNVNAIFKASNFHIKSVSNDTKLLGYLRKKENKHGEDYECRMSS